MIGFSALFYPEHERFYNALVHHLLEIEMYAEGPDEADDLIELLMPAYLRREQFLRCRQVFLELYEWTSDDFTHALTSFHELALYQFVEHVADLQSDIPELDSIYFDEHIEGLLERACARERANGPDEPDLELFYRNLSTMGELLFDDLDFLIIPTLQSQRTLGSTLLERRLGINIDFYFELLPLDIQWQYPSGHITLVGELEALIEYLDRRVSRGSLNKLLWNEGKPADERRIQLVLENVIDAYFENRPVDITREAQLADGKIDFKFYMNQDEKVLVEVKRANSSYLKRGYERQLLSYLESSNYTNAFYLIVCFSDHDYERAHTFIRENVYTDVMQLYINIAVLDARKRRPASRR
ncbi:hypothetical protein [Thermophilibacter sp.]